MNGKKLNGPIEDSSLLLDNNFRRRIFHETNL